jgi:hypothetical protein
MCYSFESSLHNWFISLGLSLSLLVKPSLENVWLSAYTLTFTQMQILEAIIWKIIKSGGNPNDMGKYIVFALIAQPLINSMFGFIATKNKYLLWMTIIYILMLIIESKRLKNNTFKIFVGPTGHLVWQRYENNEWISILGHPINKYLYLVGLTLPLCFVQTPIMKYASVISVMTSFLYSYKNYNDEEFSSMWCYISVGFILVANIISHLIIK